MPGIAPAGGLRRALAKAGASLLALVRTRIELASVEFSEERQRAVSRIILAVVAATFIAFAVLLASALVVLLFWDTHRIAALAAVTVVHAAIGTGALLRLRADQRTAPTPFAATIAEFERDGQWLSDAVSERTNPPGGGAR
jgi:uncharacterized membrane protein YqjE